MTTTRPTAGVPTGAPADGLRSKEGALSRNDNFVRIPHWLLAEPEHLTVPEFMVYIVLLRYRNHHTGQCFPGFGTISRESRLSRRTVISTIQALEKRGVIHVDRQKNKANTYTVKLPDEAFTSATAALPSTGHAAQSEPSEAFLGSATAAPPSATTAPGSATAAPQLVQELHPNKKEITSSTNKTNGQAITVPASAATAPAGFTETTPPPLASDAQLDLLHDLFVHITDQKPPGPQIDAWRKLTVSEAVETIDAWKKQLPARLGLRTVRRRLRHPHRHRPSMG